MFKPIKSVNSKAFLALYLVITLIILVLWLSRMEFTQPDRRDIPDNLRKFLISPPQLIPQFVLQDHEKRVLTNVSLDGKWSFVYFTHLYCEPECAVVVKVMQHLQRLFAGPSIQFLIINFGDNADTTILSSLSLGLKTYGGSSEVIEAIVKSVDFLYLEPDELEHSLKVEQQHYIYLIDPQGRAYAVFKPPFTSLAIQKIFFQIRDFYARSE
jgi:cytochrome oxidase Cu insertion factor (SCO1/SenC/PrrC family)